MSELSKVLFPNKATGDTFTAAEVNELKSKLNAVVDYLNNLSSTPTPTPVPTPSGTDVTVLLMSGQSNCLGVGRIADMTGTPLATLSPSILREYQRVMIWNPSVNAFQKLKAPVNNIGYGEAFGAEIGIAQRWEEVNASEILYIVKYPRDGRPIEDWDKANVNGAGGYNDFVTNKVNKAKAALVTQGFTPVIKGFYWMQGESNAGDNNYAQKLQSFTNNLTLDSVINQGTKVVIGKVRSDATVGQQDVIYVNNNPAIAKLVDTQGWAMNNDNLHYSAMGQYLGGYTDVFNAVFNLNTAYPFAMNAVVKSDDAATGKATLLSNSEYVTLTGTYANASGGGWQGNAKYTTTTGDFIEFKFVGTKFDFYGMDSAGFSQVFKVTIDGAVVDNINVPATADSAEKILYTKTVASGTHTVRITMVGGILVMSKIVINDTVVPVVTSPVTYLGNDSRIAYTGSYGGASGSGWHINAKYTTSANDYFELEVEGSKLDFYGMDSSSFNQVFKVSIDGVVVDNINIPSSADSAEKIIYTKSLTSGKHTVRFTMVSGILVMSKIIVS